jgi:phosphatidylglycerophosphatase A
VARLNGSALLASGLGAGYVPRAPGTAASLLALVAGAGLMRLPAPVLPAAVAAASLAGLRAVHLASGGADAGWVVIDEVAGQWLALVGLARPRLTGLLAAFALFRVLDVAKPGPIGWADRQAGAAAVMGDDLIAGGLTACALWAIRRRFPGVLD